MNRAQFAHPHGFLAMIDHKLLRQAYLLEIARRIAEPEGHLVVSRARAVIEKWAASDGVLPRYVSGWRQILNGGAEAVRKLATSDTDEARELQHCMPFAGILTNKERQALRKKA